MAFTRALYYPTIDITNEQWLKTAILYWDEISTIVPSSIDHPYRQRTTQFLADEGVIRPLFVNSDMDLIDGLTDDVLNYLNSNEGYQVLTHTENGAAIHPQKLPREIREIYRIHPAKMPYILRDQLQGYMDRDGWFHINGSFANFYMTLLTNRLCEQYGIAPLTDNTYTSNFSNLARLDNQVAVYNHWDYPWRDCHIRNRGHQLAQGILMDLSFNGITISDEVSINDILKFKRQHQNELGLFRTNIENLTKNIPVDATIEQIRQQVHDIYVNQFLPGYNDLKKSLSGAGIKWVANNFMKISFFATGGTALPTALLGLSIPSALLAGAVASVISSVVLYNAEKQDTLRHNPYSYLLAMNNGI
ncbi:DUF6236 family protein [Alistipes sp.]|uniref:DUF6236 family protein n=1 Tax=Alistipes sp. TaxID=1872444 RepID=UPI0025BA21DE|nr:DUF6236 family protein [Alistipes sp.]